MIPLDMNRFERFVMQYLPHHLKEAVPRVHRDIYGHLFDVYKGDVTRLVMEAPRGIGKSMLVRFFMIYCVCEGRWEELQIFTRTGGDSKSLAVKHMNFIKKELEENDVLRADYAIEKAGPWGAENIRVSRDGNFTVDLFCRGKKASARGLRGLVFIDDPQDNDDVKSETVLSRDEDWFFSDILPILLKDQPLIFLGTSMSPLSLLYKTKDLYRERDNAVVVEFPVEDVNGNSVWPEHYSNEFLAERKRELGIDRYNAEYMCQPMVSGNPVFKKEWFKSYEPESAQFRKLLDDGLYTVVGFDGAESKSDSADYTGIVTLSATGGRKPSVFVREVRQWRWSVKEGADQLLNIYDKFQQHRTVVESRCVYPNKDAIIEELDEKQKLYNKFINVDQVKPKKDKVSRANYVQSLFQEGRVFFDFRDRGHQKLISELTMFTGDGKFHDDLVDAIVHALTHIKSWSGRAKGKSDPHIVRGSKIKGRRGRGPHIVRNVA